ncbi:MAG: flavohemoglobin expression-modulating QEGLA motif protein [Candidatus Cyclobacteriaceae bacterium M3_2C_046]
MINQGVQNEIKVNEWINQVKDHFEQQKSAAIKFPHGGEFFMEQQVPVLLMYRKNERSDPFIQSLVQNESSYLIAEQMENDAIILFVRQLADLMVRQFGAFFILELWSQSGSKNTFTIYGPGNYIQSTIDRLKKQILHIQTDQLPLNVAINNMEKRSPEHLLPVMEVDELKQKETLYVGLQIPTIYRNHEDNSEYPLLIRDLKNKFSTIFKKTFFEFVKVQTNYEINNYHVFGRKKIDQLVYDIDEQLARINQTYNFLLLVTPINEYEAWQEFQTNHFQKTPSFRYRLIPIDPEKMKQKLYNLPVDDIDDPTLSFLFRDKRAETDQMLNMLMYRNTEKFLYGSLQVFGRVKKQLLNIANGLLSVYPFENQQETKNGQITTEAFSQMAHQELQYLKQQYEAVEDQVEIKSTISGIMVSRGRLFLNNHFSIPAERAQALIQHEIGTHVLTYYNGKAQPLKLFYTGVPGYEELQEGLAVLAEYLAGGLTIRRLQTLAARVIAVDALTDGYDFVNTFYRLKDEFKLPEKLAFNIVFRVFRSGGLTKDAVYLKGFIELLEYVKQGHALEPLLVGKIRHDYLPLVEELRYRAFLNPAPIRPRYLQDQECLDRLGSINQNTTIFNLV